MNIDVVMALCVSGHFDLSKLFQKVFQLGLQFQYSD